MKYLILVLFISSKIFSQEITVPVEEKSKYLFNNPNYENYVFKDLNNVFEKFLGKWKFENETCKINIEIFKYFDKDNQQDAIYVNVKFIKDNNLIMDTSQFAGPNYITGGYFDDKNKIDSLIVSFSEINKTWICGHVSRLNLTCKNTDTLVWEIEKKELLFNKTASLFPREISFIKQ